MSDQHGKQHDKQGNSQPMGGEDSTNENQEFRDSRLGEKFGYNLGFGREGEHVEPQSYGGEQPQGTEVVDRYDRPQQTELILEGGQHAGKGPLNRPAPTGTALDDVIVRLEQHPQVDASHIEVSLEETVITLRGHVASQREIDLAEEVAREVPGVTDVLVELQVQAG